MGLGDKKGEVAHLAMSRKALGTTGVCLFFLLPIGFFGTLF